MAPVKKEKPAPVTTKTDTTASATDHNDSSTVATASSADESTPGPTSPPSEDKRQEVSNPQDATLRKIINGEHIEQLNSGESTKPSKPSNLPTVSRNNATWKKRKRGRYVRLASVDDHEGNKCSFPPLPGNQYKATLRRRAIRKLEGAIPGASSMDQNEEYGDISLGMKLIVVGGRVIVQTLTALADGRASPAQLAGKIQRGDVLLSIGNLSLVNLPLDQLMEGLKPLSTPGPGGSYQRILSLRFEASVGLDALKSHEEHLEWKTSVANTYERQGSMDAANDMFSLFPMVDQLSGAPLFEEQRLEAKVSEKKIDTIEEKPSEASTDSADTSVIVQAKEEPDSVISSALARQRKLDREMFASEFFTLNDELSEWLRATMRIVYTETGETGGMTQSERVEQGKKVMAVVKALSYSMEEIDKGKDMRSFQRWNSTLSLRSRASARRRYVLDSASVPAHRRTHEPEVPIDESVGSEDSGSIEGVDGDELLLGLAAHDGVWRKQVVGELEKAIHEMENYSDSDEKEEEKEALAHDMDSALTKELGTFLFGENMARLITKKKRSFALPPDEITSVLFDLTTNIAVSAPDEITVFGQATTNYSIQSSFISGKTKSSISDDVILATLFMLDEALPLWLKSFRPLPLGERRVLWPRGRHASADSHAGTNTVMSDDSMTVESLGSTSRSPSVATTKNLRQLIEDQELDIETRAETCFLVTYYFTQHLLPTCSSIQHEPPTKVALDEAISFIKSYGAYLQMHTCLSCAANFHAEALIEPLLAVADHDPSHRDALREVHKANNMIFYDPVKLSAVIMFLSVVRFEVKAERRRVLIHLCVSAYPDVQPWQVRQACLEPSPQSTTDPEMKKPCSEECMSELFYTYLSLLLHPMDGHDAARHDVKLVKEWCERSVGVLPPSSLNNHGAKERLQNFYSVASRASSDHLAYHRDFVMLLDLSMNLVDHDLALDLAAEILESKKLLCNDEALDRVIQYLRTIALDALLSARDPKQSTTGFRLLKRVLRLFTKMSASKSQRCRQSIVVAHELRTLLEHWKDDAAISGNDDTMLSLIDFLIAESAPGHVLRALSLWSDTYGLGSSVFSRLNILLRRGVHVALKSELSGTLLRLKHARLTFTDANITDTIPDSNLGETDGIWRRMSAGTLSIDK